MKNADALQVKANEAAHAVAEVVRALPDWAIVLLCVVALLGVLR